MRRSASQVLDYDRKHGYRGPEAFIDLSADAKAPRAADRGCDRRGRSTVRDLLAAVVLEGRVRSWSRSTLQGGSDVRHRAATDCKFVARSLDAEGATDRQDRARGRRAHRRGDDKAAGRSCSRRRSRRRSSRVDSHDGAIRALVGGFDFNLNKFNHVTQAWRQPGSSFKPFIYSAALEKGFMASTLINDAPIIIDPATTGGQVWEPKNYDGKFEGPMRLRQGLAQVEEHGVDPDAAEHRAPTTRRTTCAASASKPEKHPAYLTMALGAGSVTPWQLLGGYSVFANGGYRVAALPDREGHRRQGQDVMAQGQSATAATTPNAPSTSATPSSWTACCARSSRSGTAARARDAQAQRHRRQDRDHQRLARCLVRRLRRRRSSRSRGWASTSRGHSANARPAAAWRCRSGSPTWDVHARECRKPRGPMPPGVTVVGDDVYYDEHQPGRGGGSRHRGTVPGVGTDQTKRRGGATRSSSCEAGSTTVGRRSALTDA